MTGEPLRVRLRALARQARQAADLLERGQAETPLSQHFQALGENLDSDPFGVIVLGLSLEARTAALAWLAGPDFRLFSVTVPREVGLIEVRLQERGFALQKADGTRLEFDQAGPFLEALKGADLVRPGDAESWVDPLCVSVAAPAGAQGLLIAMPENLAAVSASPALLARLVSTSSLMIVAGDAGHPLSPEERETLTQLAASMAALWPVLTTADPLPPRGWWNDPELGSATLLLPATTTSAARGFVGSGADPLREGLFAAHAARRMKLSADMLADRHQSETRQLAGRQAALQRRSRLLESAGRDGDSRSPVEAIKMEFQDELAKLQEGIAEANRKAMLPEGRITGRMKEALAAMSGADLVQQQTYTAIQLSVHARFQRDVTDTAKAALKDQLKEDLVHLRDGLDLIRKHVEGRLASSARLSPTLELPPPADHDVWKSVSDLVSVEIKYRGEMPKRGFVERLSEGRRKVFVVLMFCSLFGSAFGFNARAPWVVYPLLLLFAGGVIGTYAGWKREDRERLEREVDRVRESVDGELKRTLSEAQREKLTRFAAHLGEIRKDTQRRIDETARESVQTRQHSADQERRDARSRTQALELRSRELTGFGQGILEVVRQAGELDMTARRQVVEAARAPAGRPA